MMKGTILAVREIQRELSSLYSTLAVVPLVS